MHTVEGLIAYSMLIESILHEVSVSKCEFRVGWEV